MEYYGQGPAIFVATTVGKFCCLYFTTTSSNCCRSGPIFTHPSPRRRMINATILLILVATVIPYQFAYMVACMVQVATCVRALWHVKETVCVSELSYDSSLLFYRTDECSAWQSTRVSSIMRIRSSRSCSGYFQSTSWSLWCGYTIWPFIG